MKDYSFIKKEEIGSFLSYRDISGYIMSEYNKRK